MSHLKSIGKSIIIGGTAAGIISLIPVINLLNLLLMMWMAFGGGLCVYLLLQENEHIKTADALLSGALSGALGCSVFGIVTYLLVANINPARMERIMKVINLISPSAAEEFSQLLQGDELKMLFVSIMAAAMLLSIISGALGGLISRSIFKKKREESNKN